MSAPTASTSKAKSRFSFGRSSNIGLPKGSIFSFKAVPAPRSTTTQHPTHANPQYSPSTDLGYRITPSPGASDTIGVFGQPIVTSTPTDEMRFSQSRRQRPESMPPPQRDLYDDAPASPSGSAFDMPTIAFSRGDIPVPVGDSSAETSMMTFSSIGVLPAAHDEDDELFSLAALDAELEHDLSTELGPTTSTPARRPAAAQPSYTRDTIPPARSTTMRTPAMPTPRRPVVVANLRGSSRSRSGSESGNEASGYRRPTPDFMQPVPSSSGRPSLDVDVASARPSMDVERPSLELGRETFAMTDSTSTSTSSFGVIIPNRTSTGYGLYASETIPQQQQQQPLQRNGGEYHPEDPRRTPFGTRDRPQPVPASVLSTSTSMPPPGSGSTKQVVLDTVRASRLAASTNSVPPVPNTKRPELDARSSDGSILTRASDVGSVRGRNKVPVPMPTHIGAVPAAAKKNRHTLGAVTRRVVSDQDASELAASNGAASVGRRTVSSRTPVRPPDVRNGPSSVGGGRKVLGVLSGLDEFGQTILPTRSRHGSMSAGTFASSIDAASNPRSSFETEGRPSLDSNTSSIPPSTTESSVPPDPTHRRHSSVFALGYNGRPNVASGGGHQRSPSYPNAHPQPQTASAVRRPSASGEGTRYTPSPTPTSATRVDHQAAFMAWRDGRGNDATWHGPRSVVGRQSTGASTGTLPWSPTSSASTSSANARSPLVQSTEVMRLMDDMQTLREKHARETEALLGALSDAQRASRAAKEDTGAIERAFGRLRDEKDALVVERDELVRMLGDYEAELAPLQDISARYDVLENEHIGLRHAHAELESAHEQMASGYDELVRVHQDLARRFEEIGGRVGRAGTQLVEENEALREEVDRLRAELQQFQEEEDQAEDLADAQAAARALREENALLRSRVREAEGRERMLQQRVDELAPPAHASPRGQASRSSLTSHSSYPSSVGHVQVQTARLDPHHSADRRSVAMPQPRHGRIVHGQPVTHNPPSLGGSPSSYSQSASRDIAPPISPSPSGSSEKENVPQSRSVRIPARGRDPTTSFLATARDAHQHGAAAPQAFHPHHTFGTYSMSNGGQAGEVTESSFNFPPEAEALSLLVHQHAESDVSEGDVFGDASPRALLTARDHWSFEDSIVTSSSHPSPGVVLGRASAARGSYASPDASTRAIRAPSLSLHRPLPTPPLQRDAFPDSPDLSGQESARLSASTNTVHGGRRQT